jgi:SAM-dependent methyltransferase
MTRGLASLFGQVDAVDVSAEMVAQARDNLSPLSNVRIHETNGLDLGPFADGTFDLCFSYIVFQHLPSFEIVSGYMREAARVLKPGGTFLFQANNAPPDRDYAFAPARALSRLWRRYGWHNVLLLRALLTRGPRGFDHPAWMGHRVTVPQVEAGLAQAGLEVCSMSGRGTAYLWVRAQKPPA